MTDDESEEYLDWIDPEEFGIKIVFSGIGLLVAIVAGWVFANLLFISSTIRFQSIGLTVLTSLVLTFLIPAIIFRYVNSYIDNISKEVLKFGNIAERGEDDRGFVGAALSVSLFGAIFYYYLPAVLSTPVKKPIDAVESGLSIPMITNVVFADIMSLCFFAIFVGGLIASYHRYKYPRSCYNCGNSGNITDDYCGSCKEPLDYIPTRKQALWTLITNQRNHYPHNDHSN